MKINQLKKALYRGYLDCNKKLGFLESIYIKDEHRPLPFKPVFILGAPRCGSTLTYQTLAATLNFSYLSNRHCFWFGSPFIVEKFTNASSEFRKNQVFESNHGFTKGWYAPSECGEFWYRFFRRFPPFVTQEEVDFKKMNKLRASLHAFINASRKPLLIKNLYTVLRLGPLINIFPEAVFLVIHRNEIDMAHSILKARERKFGNYKEWFSLETPDFELLKNKPPEAQVVEQIRTTYRLISEAEKNSRSPFLHLNYEDFCEDPNYAITRIKAFLKSTHVKVQQVSKAPPVFKRRNKVTIDQVLYKRLSLYIAENPIS